MKLIASEGSRTKLIINLVVLSLAFYGVSKRKAPYKEASIFENVMMDTLAPLQRGISNAYKNVASFFEDYMLNVNASKENVTLKEQIGSLKQEVFALKQLEQENQRLRQILNFGKKIKHEMISAQVVAWDSSSDFRVIRIDKGFKDGIKLQSTVVTSDGIVGYVYRLTDHFADILTILDPSNRVDVIVNRTRSYGILEGYSGWRTVMKYVVRTDPVRLNDLVITSGLGNIYPRGIPVGIITKIERESYGITQHLEVTPTVDFSKLEEVAVLVPSEDQDKKRVEWEALENNAQQGDGR
ncbi:rod shape-determining protein MreC [Halobacteriovorax sp. XZX-3]|uniref:rod shape-determining protein MreC n=1 Tax=unclassified Halobacteriovorax TaxID=2639665 RepID=UPI000CD2FD6B|nr:rod shape-determining protein MreC [Halobacteriovorax sp. DA5]POB14010.1 rod shape-determining protein MreC [Halobacteriovorax sp. DA5]